MANITGVTSILPTSNEGYVDNLSASISSGASTVPVNSASAYQDGDVVVLTVDPGVPEEATFTGTKASSPDRFVNCEWTEGNIGAGHASGSAVVDYVSATHYNLLAKALKGILNQDGSYKSSVLESILNVNQRTKDIYGDFIVQAPITDTTGLAQTYGEVIGYIGGARIKADSGAVKVLTATSDNYVTLDNSGAINVIAVAVSSPQPALPANSLWLGKYTTNATAVTATNETLRVTSPIATKSIQNKAVTAPKIDFATFTSRVSTDARGWKVTDMGGYVEYSKQFSFNSLAIESGLTQSYQDLPIGVTNMAGLDFETSQFNFGSAPAWQTATIEPNSTTLASATQFRLQIGNISKAVASGARIVQVVFRKYI